MSLLILFTPRSSDVADWSQFNSLVGRTTLVAHYPLGGGINKTVHDSFLLSPFDAAIARENWVRAGILSES